MVSRYRAREYQHAADRRNDTFMKQTYYQQTARYFERESGIAKHYDSWYTKDEDAKDQAEKERKSEQLQDRRDKLQTLLKEEEESYEREGKQGDQTDSAHRVSESRADSRAGKEDEQECDRSDRSCEGGHEVARRPSLNTEGRRMSTDKENHGEESSASPRHSDSNKGSTMMEILSAGYSEGGAPTHTSSNEDRNQTSASEFYSQSRAPPEQMIVYLRDRELKSQIEELSRKELRACTKQNWDEALRFRDIRNRLELVRDKRLYATEKVGMDEDSRKLGLRSIDKREEELATREDACADSTMYSEDARALWNKWVREDELSPIVDTKEQRENLMTKLEEEWQNLTVRDKDMISRCYRQTMSGSALQQEHKLAANLTTTVGNPPSTSVGQSQ